MTAVLKQLSSDQHAMLKHQLQQQLMGSRALFKQQQLRERFVRGFWLCLLLLHYSNIIEPELKQLSVYLLYPAIVLWLLGLSIETYHFYRQWHILRPFKDELASLQYLQTKAQILAVSDAKRAGFIQLQLCYQDLQQQPQQQCFDLLYPQQIQLIKPSQMYGMALPQTHPEQLVGAEVELCFLMQSKQLLQLRIVQHEPRWLAVHQINYSNTPKTRLWLLHCAGVLYHSPTHHLADIGNIIFVRDHADSFHLVFEKNDASSFQIDQASPCFAQFEQWMLDYFDLGFFQHYQALKNDPTHCRVVLRHAPQSLPNPEKLHYLANQRENLAGILWILLGLTGFFSLLFFGLKAFFLLAVLVFMLLIFQHYNAMRYERDRFRVVGL